MRVSSNEKFLQFDQESERKIKPKYNVPFEKKDSTVQVGITNFFSKLHKQRFDKVKENLKKNKNNFNISRSYIIKDIKLWKAAAKKISKLKR